MFAPLKYWSWRMYFNQNISTTHPNQHPTCSCPSSTVVLWFSRQNRWTWFLELLVKYAFNISLTSYIMLFLFVLHNSSSSRHVFHVHMLSWVITVHIETRLKGRKQLLPNETEMMTLIDELKEEVRAVIMSNTGHEDTVSRDKCKEGEGGERNCETETARGRKNANTLIQSCKTNFRSIFFWECGIKDVVVLYLKIRCLWFQGLR